MEKITRNWAFLFIGLAFFATYFGAGNLVFPPMIGIQNGTGYPAGLAGLAISGIFLPLFSLFAIAKAGESVKSITDHAFKNLDKVLLTISMLLCVVVSIPRTAAVAIELGLQGAWSSAPYFVSIVIYFLIAFLFARTKIGALDKVGKILTPVMVIILFILVVVGIFNPMGTPQISTVGNNFTFAFLQGYQTGDVVVSFLMAAVFMEQIHSHGYQPGKETRKIALKACLIAFICLFVIYGGLLYLGATAGSKYSPEIGNATLLVAIIKDIGGSFAMVPFAIAVVLACLTTAIGQLTAVADFFEDLTGGKVKYIIFLCSNVLVSLLVASVGLDTIVSVALPLFGLIYPLCIVLSLLGFFKKYVPNDGAYKGSVVLVVIYSVLDTILAYGANLPPVSAALGILPFYSAGFGWIAPAVAGFVAGIVIYGVKAGKDTEPTAI
ncbi:MAG: branched-chain amino acid transport system II carrier protein [Peptococcaceae bacterium]|nr:branched-chain amino acid transport system II carrier protein [Peptococcaceae bacterium]